MFCSAIIPTIGRQTLSRAVNSILKQEFDKDDFEVIVVNDTGKPIPEMNWQHSPFVKMIITQRRERSVARNTGAALARGEYLYFLDDDDIMLPGGLEEFWNLSQSTTAKWLFGSYRTVDNSGNILAEFHPDLTGNISAWLVAGESIPLQSSMFHTSVFYDAGEFDVYFTGAQDRDLERRISTRCQVSNTQKIVAQIRVGKTKSSTDWSKLKEFDRWGREKAFDQLNAFPAIRESARGNKHLQGRVGRAYLASVVWNISRGHYLRAASRLLSCGAFCLPNILYPSFWKGTQTRIPPLGNLDQR